MVYFQSMKLIIQIPCHNEAEVITNTIRTLPGSVEGFDTVEYLVIDDGSQDDTGRLAIEAGAHHLIKLPGHMGLAAAFTSGLEACIDHGADVIVNTDADNQYHAEDICLLVKPIIDGKAQIVVGDRGVATLQEFSPFKRMLQRMGSWVVTRISGINIPDATSGFRALTREAALRTLVLNDYSYTLETLIQAGARKMPVEYVKIRTNPKTRPSRLIRSIPQYLANSSATIVRSYTMYRPLRVFTLFGSLFILGGLILASRFLYYYIIGQGGGHLQSIVLSAVLLIVGFQVILIGLLADLIGFNRKILEEVLYRIKFQGQKSKDQETNNEGDKFK
jgi:glycosyltransferase involved in cell wall biosynthesis